MVRRSYRLEGKPQPTYDFKNYLKMSIVRAESKKMTETKRLRKKEKVEKMRGERYDNIISSVLENVVLNNCEASDIIDSEGENARRVSESNSVETSPDLTDSDDDEDSATSSVVKMETTTHQVKVYNCYACHKVHQDHHALHEHIVKAHTSEEKIRCIECTANWTTIMDRNVCSICGDYCLNLNEHLKEHYRDCTSDSAFMECRQCYRKFSTLSEVLEHEKSHNLVHRNRKHNNAYKCIHCPLTFHSKPGADSHSVEHVAPIMKSTRFWQWIEELQTRANCHPTECPMCRKILINRKSFRTHIEIKHLISSVEFYQKCKRVCELEFETVEIPVKMEVTENTEYGAGNTMEREIKQEVKEEPIDEGYPAV